jgi:hypothetical protein
MNEGRKKWLHNAMLLGALAAGIVTARMMPAYEQHVGTVTYPSRAAAARSGEDAPRGYSQTENEELKLTLVRNTK